MAPEKKCWGGGNRAVKVPTMRGVQVSLQTMPIALPKKTKKTTKGHGFYEVPKVHGNLGAGDPLPPLGPSLHRAKGAIWGL